MENYYEVLNLMNFADIEIVKASYKALSKKYHPDLNKNVDPNKMVQINRAYETLGDVDKKRQYDNELRKFLEEQKIDKKKSNRDYTTHFENTSDFERSKSNSLRFILSIIVGLVLSVIGSFILVVIIPEDGSWSYILYLIYGSVLGEIIANIAKSRSRYLATIASLITIFGILFPFYSYLYDVIPTVYGEMSSIEMLITATSNIIEVFFGNGFIRMIFVILTPCLTFYSILEKEFN